jgi:HSP90 family molecular chaperone
MPKIVDNVEIKQDFEGMLRRALERIIQLYTDKSHFVYELLQNAEDAGAKSIKFVQYADRLEVFHDGKPFTEQNLKSLCDIGASDKAGDLNQIGEFGVGFKSVFGI